MQRPSASSSVDAGAAAERAVDNPIRRAGDRRRASTSSAGIVELGRVGEVEGLGAEFEIKSLGHLEVLGEREIEREEPGAAQDIAARGAEPDACRLDKAGGAEPRVADIDAVQDLHLPNLVRGLRFARCVEAAAAGAENQGRSRRESQDTGELPVAQHPGGRTMREPLLSDARRMQGKDFSMLQFNDFVWNNGNVPISLQRWELLQDAIEVP